jgi:hypothetical protein
MRRSRSAGVDEAQADAHANGGTEMEQLMLVSCAHCGDKNAVIYNLSSDPVEKVVTCAHCGEDFSITFWITINTSVTRTRKSAAQGYKNEHTAL